MRILTVALSLLLLPTFAHEPILDWNVQCTSDRAKCWIEKLVDFSGPKKMERGGVAVAYDGSASKPMYITVFVPNNLKKGTEVVVSFVDSVPEGDGWKLQQAESGMIGLPVMECDGQFCMARVYPQIDNGDGTTTDLFAELQARRFLWVMFKRSKNPERFMVPVSGFPSALRQVNGRSGESIQPLKPTR